MQAVNASVIGDAGVGKTLLAVSYTANYVFKEYKPTVFDSYWTNTIVDDTPIDLTVWDNSGQDIYSTLRPLSYPHSDVFLICFSLVCRKSFNNLRKWHKELQTHTAGAPFIIVGCQKDLCSDRGVPVTFGEGKDLVADIGAVDYIETSAVLQEGLENCFNTAIRAALTWQREKHCR